MKDQLKSTVKRSSTNSAILTMTSMIFCSVSAMAQPASKQPGAAILQAPQAGSQVVGVAPPAPPLETGLQPPPPPPPSIPFPANKSSGGFPAPVANAASISINGTVEQYLLNPHGEADGLYLTDGKQIHFPPHMSAQLLATIRPGNKISATGFSDGRAVFTATSVTNSNTRQTLLNAGPQPGLPPSPPVLQGNDLRPLRAQSTIKAFLYGPRGDVNGYLLSDKTIVRMPPETAFRLSSVFQVGQKMTAEGYGSESTAGRCIEATALGTANQPLISIYGANTVPPQPVSPGL